ncbi:GNAT family N-acetyltransferase [Streptomyces sp. NPDC001404]|uniref:GNAT family N-acetyltransferase n=1 Tax=Streptomyces sp. NPDC001404 TaxID=3364571 RepID=UPI0036C40759
MGAVRACSPSWATAADIPAIREINLAAFDTPLEADLVDALRADGSWTDGLSVVAADPDGTLVGHTLLTRCHIGDTPALCLAPVAVRRPEQQGSGAGSAAVRAALNAAKEFDVPDEALMVLSLDASRPLPRGTVRYAAPFGI